MSRDLDRTRLTRRQARGLLIKLATPLKATGDMTKDRHAYLDAVERFQEHCSRNGGSFPVTMTRLIHFALEAAEMMAGKL